MGAPPAMTASTSTVRWSSRVRETSALKDDWEGLALSPESAPVRVNQLRGGAAVGGRQRLARVQRVGDRRRSGPHGGQRGTAGRVLGLYCRWQFRQTSLMS